MASEYTCTRCHRTYDRVISDEEALAEARAVWGDDLGSEPVVVCDDCYQTMTAILPPWAARILHNFHKGDLAE